MINEQKILFLNKSDISVHDADELHSLNLNKWKGWWCSAGIRSLYINHDGNIYRGTCETSGLRGNIYNTGIGKNYKWIECDKEVCACGSDMQSPKVKDIKDIGIVTSSYIKPLDYSNLNIVDQVTNPDVIACGAFSQYKMVIWEIGRRCNYNCWYCVPDSHNNYESHKTLGSFMHGLDNLNEYWSENQKMKFVFTGGEPTFNPDFLEFITHLHDDLLHIVHTTTNGSHTPEYYSKLIKVSDIGFSAHLNYLETPNIYKKFIKNIESAVTTKANNTSAGFNWLGVRIMLQPGRLDLAKQLYKDCKNVIGNITIDLLHDKNKQIMPYSQEEVDWLIENNNENIS